MRTYGTLGLAALCAVALAACNNNGNNANGNLDTAVAVAPTVSDSAAGVSATSAFDSTTPPAGAAITTDAAMLAHLHVADSGEVALGRYMRTNSQDAQVKSFAQMLERDHAQNLSKVEAAAKKMKSVSATDLPNADAAQQKAENLLNQLKSLNGTARDSAFITAEIQDHQQEISQLQAAQNSMQNDEVKQLVSNTLPVLQKHLDKAQSIAKAKNWQS